jgi:hyperosmotically inducible periplasmic protein
MAMRYGRASLAVFLAFFLAACQTLTGSTAGENIDDARITLAIKTKLAEEKAATLTRVGVKTVQGTVYLTGVVESEELRQRASDVANEFEGVREVVNNLKVGPRQ